MPPILALTLSLTFTLCLVLYDRRHGVKMSPALWIPFLWLFFLGSRSLSTWLSFGPAYGDAAQGMAEGNPFDRNTYTVLMVLGVAVLMRRRVSLADFARRNVWILLFIVYTGLSVLWSDFPAVASKRWIKSLGDPIMALVVLSEPNPAGAVAVLFKRLAYLLLPLSVVFIKYFPELGREYEPWTGWAMYTGVATNKNMLGYLLFVFGLFFVTMLFGRLGRHGPENGRLDTGVALVFIGIVAWLFKMSDSKTPLLCLVLAILVFFASGFGGVRRYWGRCLAVGLVLFSLLQLTVGVGELVVASTGRDMSLTGRTDLWESVLDLSGSPWLGVGFASFWLGERLDRLWAMWQFQPTQAHNGYLDTYINIGWFGVIGVVGMIAAAYRNLQGRWLQPGDSTPYALVTRDWARFGMAYVVGIIVYNITETTFQSLNLLHVIFLIVAMTPPQLRRTLAVAGAARPAARKAPAVAPSRPAEVVRRTDDRGVAGPPPLERRAWLRAIAPRVRAAGGAAGAEPRAGVSGQRPRRQRP